MIKELKLNDDVEISLDNIGEISKYIALSSLKHFEVYSYIHSKRIAVLHKQLQKDIFLHSELDNYSDAYDLVQEASLFLLKYVGKRLGDNCIYIKSNVKQPQTISIRLACLKTLFVYIRKELKNGNTENDELLEFIPTEEPFEEEKPDYTKVNEIIRKIVTNELEMKILEYYYNGVEVKDIAEFLNISIWKVYKRKRKFKDRYLAYCN